MATVKKVQLKLTLTDGKIAVINLPAPINNTLTDPETGDLFLNPVFAAIEAVYETDDGEHVTDMSTSIIETKTTLISESVH